MKLVSRAVIVVVILLVSAGTMVLVGRGSHAGRNATGAAAGPVAASAPMTVALGQFSPLDPPRPAPDISFSDASGASLSLADFRGRVVLVNLWATWCDPCIREMPSLDRLEGELGGAEFAVVAISQDRGGAHAVAPFVERLGLTRLKTYLDPKSTAGRAFGVQGLPTSILIDREGREIGRLEGAAEWDGPTLKQLIRRALGPPGPEMQKAAAPLPPRG